jgi:hypothetical protein
MTGLRRAECMNTLSIFSEDHVQKTHEGACNVLAQTGIIINDFEVIDILKQAGCEADKEYRRVKIPPTVVENALKTTPKKVSLYTRGGGRRKGESQETADSERYLRIEVTFADCSESIGAGQTIFTMADSTKASLSSDGGVDVARYALRITGHHSCGNPCLGNHYPACPAGNAIGDGTDHDNDLSRPGRGGHGQFDHLGYQDVFLPGTTGY